MTGIICKQERDRSSLEEFRHGFLTADNVKICVEILRFLLPIYLLYIELATRWCVHLKGEFSESKQQEEEVAREIYILGK